jgi:hypothetical protein
MAKKYFLYGESKVIEDSFEALGQLTGFIYGRLSESSQSTEDHQFFSRLYNPLRHLHDSISPSVKKIVDIDLAAPGARSQMVNEIIQAITSTDAKTPEDLIFKLNLILSKYEVIGIDESRNGGDDDEDNLPF